MDSNSLKLILQEGEGLRVEFKEKISSLDREIVAMANSVGGSIFLGVTDRGDICGISITNELKSKIVDIARNCDPSINVQLIDYKKEQVLEVKIAEGFDKPYRCKDGFFLRVGPNAQKLNRNEIVTLINDSDKICFDEAINNRFVYPKDFSSAALTDFKKLCGIKDKFTNKDVLLSLNIASEQKKQLKFTNTGVLFFAKQPELFFPESFITAVLYKSKDRFSILDQKDFKGPLLWQIEQSLDFVIRNIRIETVINPLRTDRLGRRQEVYDYPVVALREAIINAVAHRDYNYDGSHIYIHMYPDRIEIENPGGLYKGMTVDSLGKRSVRRNRLIADLLHRAKYIERVGSGFARMEQTLKQNNNPSLQVIATNFFNIKFLRKISDESWIVLTERQRLLLETLQERKQINKKTMAAILRVSEDTALRELNSLIAKGFVCKSGVGKATSYFLKK